MWSAIAVMQPEMAPIENETPSISLSIGRMSPPVLWARSKACRMARRSGPKGVPGMASVCGAARAPHPGHLPIRTHEEAAAGLEAERQRYAELNRRLGGGRKRHTGGYRPRKGDLSFFMNR